MCKTIYLKIFNVFKVAVPYILFIFLFVVSSGYPLKFGVLNTINNVLLIASVIILFICFILLYPIYNGKNKKETIIKTIRSLFDFPFFLLLSVALCSLYSFIFLDTFSNASLNTFISNVCLFLFAYLFTKLFSFEKFLRIFKIVFPVLVSISLVVYFITLSQSVAPDFLLVDGISNNFVYSNMLYVTFVNNNIITRNCGIFSEPGLYAIFLLIALILECYKNHKPRISIIILYIIATLTTLSTMAFLIFVPAACLALSFYCRFTSKRVPYKMLIISAVALIILCVPILIIYPSIFEKISFDSVSFQSRFFGPHVCFRIFLDNPLGVGITNEGLLFFDYVSLLKLDIDAQTSSYGLYLASYGFFGLFIVFLPLIGIAQNKSFTVAQKILLIFLVIIFFNVEPIEFSLLPIVLIMYLLKHNQQNIFVLAKIRYDCVFSSIKKNENIYLFVKNSAGTYLVKGVGLVIGLLTTPLYSSYFNNNTILGVWFTILSVITWVLTIDLGLGNGLRNKLVEAFAKKDEQYTKELISSSYFSSFAMALLLIIIGVVAFQFIDFNSLFNVDKSIITSDTIKISLIIVYSGICCQFLFKLVGNIFQAMQLQSVSNSFSIFTNFLLILFVVVFQTDGIDEKLIGLSIAYFIASNLPMIVATIILFLTKLKNLWPSPKHFRPLVAKSVLSLGIGFFVIQLCLIVLNSSNEFLITQLFDPSDVTSYTYYNKLYNAILTISTLLSGPVVTIVAKAKVEHNISQIKKMVKFLRFCELFFVFCAVALFVFMPIVFEVWLGANAIPVDWVVNISFLIYTIIMILTLETAISNGLNFLKVQIISLICSAVVKIPLSFFFSVMLRDSIGWASILLASSLSLLPVIIAIPITNKILIDKLTRTEENYG